MIDRIIELDRLIDDVLDSYYPSGWSGNMKDDLKHLIAQHDSTLKAEYEEKVREARLDEVGLIPEGLLHYYASEHKAERRASLTQPPKEGTQ